MRNITLPSITIETQLLVNVNTLRSSEVLKIIQHGGLSFDVAWRAKFSLVARDMACYFFTR